MRTRLRASSSRLALLDEPSPGTNAAIFESPRFCGSGLVLNLYRPEFSGKFSIPFGAYLLRVIALVTD